MKRYTLSRFQSDPFTLGVASGDPLPGGIVLWTRLAPEPLDGGGMPTANADVAWELAADEGFKTIVQKGSTLDSSRSRIRRA